MNEYEDVAGRVCVCVCVCVCGLHDCCLSVGSVQLMPALRDAVSQCFIGDALVHLGVMCAERQTTEKDGERMGERERERTGAGRKEDTRRWWMDGRMVDMLII